MKTQTTVNYCLGHSVLIVVCSERRTDSMNIHKLVISTQKKKSKARIKKGDSLTVALKLVQEEASIFKRQVKRPVDWLCRKIRARLSEHNLNALKPNVAVLRFRHLPAH